MSRIADFDQYLRLNAIPIDGISQMSGSPPESITIQFRPEATQEQIAWAEQAKELFDWRPRRLLDRAIVETNLRGLSLQQLAAIRGHMLAADLLAKKSLADRVLSELGISLPLDEVDPNPPENPI